MYLKIELQDYLSKVNLESVVNLAKQHKVPAEIAALMHLEFLMSKRPAIAVAPADPPPQAKPVAKTQESTPELAAKPSSKRAVSSDSEESTVFDSFGFSTRTLNVLTKPDKLNVSTIEGLLALTKKDIEECKGAGKLVVDEILAAQSKLDPSSTKVAGPPTATVKVVKESSAPNKPSAFDIVNSVSADKDGMIQAVAVTVEALGVSKQDIKSVLESQGISTNQYAEVINVLRSMFPIQANQVKEVKKLGSELGEKSSVFENDRPAAMFSGKKLDELTFGEANALIEEMRGDLKEKLESNSSPTEDDIDDFF